MKNILFAISGPSGVGKGTLVKMLLEGDENLVSSVSCTTRAPRAGETDGEDYFFIDRETFEKKIAAGGFLEYDEHFGNYYGTPLSFVEETLQKKSVILEIDVKGAMSAKAKKPDTVTIFIAPPSAEELKKRLRGRHSESEEQIAERVARAEYEESFAPQLYGDQRRPQRSLHPIAVYHRIRTGKRINRIKYRRKAEKE